MNTVWHGSRKSRHHPWTGLASLGLAALFGAVVLVGFNAISEVIAEVDGAVDTDLRQRDLATRMRQAARERLMLLSRMSLARDPFERYELLEEFYRHGQRFLHAREELLKTPLDLEERKLLDRQERATMRSAPLQREIAEDLVFGDAEQATRRILTDSFAAQARTLDAIDQFLALQGRQHREAMERLSAGARRSFLMLAATTGMFVVAGILFATLSLAGQRRALLEAETQQARLHGINRGLRRQLADLQRQLEGTRRRLGSREVVDRVTGLAGPELLQQRLRETADADADPVLILVDIAGVERANEALGTGAGDTLLRLCAQRLQSRTPEGGLVVRLGGCHFAMLWPADPGPDAVRGQLEELVAELADGILMRGVAWHLEATVGAAARQGGPEELMDRAHEALRRARRSASGYRIAITAGRA